MLGVARRAGRGYLVHVHGPSTRPPAVAGAFYDDRPQRLAAEVDGYLRHPARPPRAVAGVMVPHAGYLFSGAICGRALSAVEVPRRVLLLHTKHHAGGGALSLADYDAWRTPLGEVPCDRALTAALARVAELTVSNAPHGREHAAEVVLPFLQRIRRDVEVAVISVGHVPYPVLERAAEHIAATLAAFDDALIVASSDMNHYDDHETTLRKDALALRELERYAPEAMLDVCDRNQITMCGAAATALMLLIARARGADTVELLEHDTSAAASGDRTRTVGYASARVY